MKTSNLFPHLPANASVKRLRLEIQRRLGIADSLGLIKRPKQ